ncbi:right-handed parallel beta-helix repeat-containing protein [Kribbella sp. NPDC058245]|uniref:right-handed parallel beta-helix repeat-containing protein n=1 Tax=Kribbella sp. NPDC058245 TaxID=3346399 RepID=UPI0036EBBACD
MTIIKWARFATALLTAASMVPAITAPLSRNRTYYLDPSGSDTSDGLSPNSAWQSLDRANSTRFSAGDSLLLRGGAHFTGTLHLDGGDAGKALQGVTIGAYGGGRATINSQAGPAVFVRNAAAVRIRDLVAAGDAAAYNTAGGIVFYNDASSGRAFPGVTISDVEVSGFNNGIEIGGPRAGFHNVVVTRGVVHDNREAGLVTYGPPFDPSAPRYANANVSVTSVEAFRNAGDATNTTRNTGSGIILGSVHGGTVARSSAHDNGWLCTAGEGPAGIWAYDSTGVVIEHNVAYRNLTGGTVDGDGFDLDQNTSDSVLQYNLAYDNDGAGFLLYAAHSGLHNKNNVVRYNVSSGSPRKGSWYGGITVAGHVSGAQVYGNKAVVAATGERPAVRLSGPLSSIVVRDNVLVAGDNGPFIAAEGVDSSAYVLQNNAYYGPSGVRR